MITIIILFLAVIIDKPVDPNADIVILGDSSLDVQQWQFEQQKSFVQKFVEGLNMSPDGSRVAFISYGRSQIRAAGFQNTRQAFSTTLGLTGYVGGSRRLDLAINEALNVFKQSRPGK